MNPWIDFFLLVAIQAIFLVIVIRAHPKNRPTARQIPLILAGGAVFGILFDLVIGSYAGVYTYVLGFGPLFMLVNGVLSFGVMMTTIFYLRNMRFWKFYAWTLLLGIIYEIANAFFPVWTWLFTNDLATRQTLVILCAYFGLSACMAVVLRIICRASFFWNRQI